MIKQILPHKAYILLPRDYSIQAPEGQRSKVLRYGEFLGWRLAVILGGYAALSMVVGCKRANPQFAAPAVKISVLTTVYPLADVARQIGGDSVDVSWVLEDGQSPDDVQATPQLAERLTRAQLVIAGGAGEPWAVEGFDDPERARHIVRLDLAPDAQLIPDARQLWLDPIIVRQSCDAIAEKLTVELPAQNNLFVKNAQSFENRIDDLMREFDSRIQGIVGLKVLVLSHDFSALDFRLKLVEVSPLNTSPLRMSDDQVLNLQKAVEAQRPAAMLLDIDTPMTVQQDLAARVGVPVIAIDARGSSAGSGHNTYLGMMRYDFEKLTGMAGGK
jgi:ABC-type Zn uptake system ZnuABC Zn-binding protein ZnuA